MKIIGLTGGIATGKSTASRRFADLGVPLIDCDQLARAVVEPGQPALRAIVRAFGARALGPDGRLDRVYLGQQIFDDPSKRALLNRITHPAIRRGILALAIEYWLQARPMVVIDAPLLIESGLHRFMSEVVVVYCPPETQLQRLCSRDLLSEKDALKRIASQDVIDSKLRLATCVLDNSTTVGALHQQVDRLVLRYTPSRLKTWFWLAGPPLSIIASFFLLCWKLLRIAAFA